MSPSTSIICLVTLLVIPWSHIQGAKILLVSISPSISHQIVFQPIWKELSLRGHNVHVVTPDPLKDPSLSNLTEYDVSSLYDGLRNMAKGTREYILQKPNFAVVFAKDMLMTKLFSNLGETAFKHNQMQKLLRTNTKFDVAVIEWIFPTMGALGAKFNCPIVGISSLGVPLVALDTIGNPSHPISSPDHNLPVTRDMNFRERLMSALYSVYVRVWYHLVVLPRVDRVVKKYLGDDLPYIGDIERNISLLLLNRNPVFHRFLPVVPSVIELGGISLKRSRPALDPKLQTFLDESKQGVIYFSLGSNIKTIFLPLETRTLLLNVFSQLPYNILLKWENDTLPEKPANVYIAEWFPQLTVLEHANTKLFIAQGGLQSSEEAISAKVPVIGFPMVADQTVNIDTMVKYGAAICLDLDSLTAVELNASIYEIMTNPSYKENIKTLSKLMHDQPQDGLTKAVWWIEYVIRNKGAKHFRIPILDIPLWQYFMLDVIGFLLTVLTISSLLLYFALRGICWGSKTILRSIWWKNTKASTKKKQ